MTSKKQAHQGAEAPVKQPSPKQDTAAVDLPTQEAALQVMPSSTARIDVGRLNARRALHLQRVIGNRAFTGLLRARDEYPETGPGVVSLSPENGPVPGLVGAVAGRLQRWSDESQSTMVRLHGGSLQEAMNAYREAIAGGETTGEALEAIKTVVREKLSTEVRRLIFGENVAELDALQTSIEGMGDAAGFLRRVFQNRVHRYLRRLFEDADAERRQRLRPLFDALGEGNWLQGIFNAYLDLMPPGAEDEQAAELAGLVEELTPEQDATQRQVTVRNLTTWFRDKAIDEDDMRAFLASGHSAAYKTQILGRVAVQFARGEFLLGWAYEGGYSQRGRWEEYGPTQTRSRGGYRNSGEYPTAYQDAVKTWGSNPAYLPPGQKPTAGNYSEWCTSFVGFLQRQMGFQGQEETREGARYSMFWSGTRLRYWLQTGKSVGGDMLSNPENLPGVQASTVFLRDRDIERLRKKLRTADESERVQTVADFFEAEGHGPPQPGDVILHPTHTMMVESYDPSTATIATIEGNKGQAVRSRDIVLSNPTDVAEVRAIIRVGAENFQGFAEGGDEDQPQVDGEELVAKIEGYVGIIANRLEGLGFIEAGAGASTQSWQAGAATGGVR